MHVRMIFCLMTTMLYASTCKLDLSKSKSKNLLQFFLKHFEVSKFSLFIQYIMQGSIKLNLENLLKS